jgi:hypothetical protein
MTDRSEVAAPAVAGENEGKEAAWQERLLPVMVPMVVGLTAFFFIATALQLVFLHRAISRSPPVDVMQVFGKLRPDSTDDEERSDASAETQRALLLLEQSSQDRHYHQANVLLMSRVWIQYLGFVTGMILSLLGAVFILGKLRENPSQLRGQVAGANFGLTTASPGVVLAVLGVVLMVTTMLVHHDIVERNVPIYFQPVPVTPKASPSKPVLVPPPPDSLGSG